MRSVIKRPAAAVLISSPKHQKISKPPAEWRADWPIIKSLRQVKDAPVDMYGCDRLADPNAEPAIFEWQVLVSAMLSSQTKDQMNAMAMEALSKHGNTIENIAQTSVDDIDRLIVCVGFHTTKAKNLQAAAEACLRHHGKRVPRDIEGLMSLPGVGPKMAYLTLGIAFGIHQGLCIDTHIHRIANSLHWISTKSAEETRVCMEGWLPKEEWKDFNATMVGLGQQQQQDPRKLVQRCLQMKSPLPALRLLCRLGVSLEEKKFPEFAAAVEHDPRLKRLVETT